MYRVGSFVAFVIFIAVPVFAGETAKHLDPPGPPKVEEFVYLYDLTLTEDQDDGILFFDGDTEILITTTITKPGHEAATYTRLIEDIDMDGDVENEFTVLNGDDDNLRPEQKGGKVKIYLHAECSPLASMNLDIEVFEVNSFGIGDVLEKLGEAAGALDESGLLEGYTWVGDAAVEVGQLLDGVGEEETSLGFDSGLVDPGISNTQTPTALYRYRTEYVTRVTSAAHCGDDDREEGWWRQSDPELDEADRSWYRFWGMGFDDEHPFTTTPSETVRRGTLLREALAAVDAIGIRDGEFLPGLDNIKDDFRSGISSMACGSIETELDEVFAEPGAMPPPFVWDAYSAWETGLTLAFESDHAGAVDSCLLFLPLMLELNHPEIFYSSFETYGFETWSVVVSAAAPPPAK